MSKEKKQDTENTEQNEVKEETAEAEKQPEQPEEQSCEEKYRELEDKYMRLCAEYDNYQKRTTREKEARYADAVIDTCAAFLPVLDNLSRALEVEVTSEDAVKVKAGVELVAKQMKDVLQKLDVTEIAAVGEEFDPNLHNAIQHTEDDTVTENTIVEEYMQGYTYKNGRVVRHSMVKVAN